MLEKTLEAKFRHEVARLGAFSEKWVAATNGVPDRIVFFDGRIIPVELKTDTGRLSHGQEVWHAKAAARGTDVWVLRGEHGLRSFVEWMGAGCPEDWPRFAAELLDRAVPTPTGCLELLDVAPTHFGHRQVRRNGRLVYAHRVTLAAATGVDLDDLPEGVFALHSCDNPPCVNPDHLRWGSQADNVADSVKRRRRAAQQRTHCPQGHALAGANLSPAHLARGQRTCLVCLRARTAVGNAGRKGEALPLDDAIAAELARTDKGRDAVARDSRS